MSYLCINKKNLLMHILFTHFRRFRSGFIQVCFCLGILLLGGCDMIESLIPQHYYKIFFLST